MANGEGYGGGHDSGELWQGDEDIGEVKPNGSGAQELMNFLLVVGKVSECDL